MKTKSLHILLISGLFILTACSTGIALGAENSVVTVDAVAEVEEQPAIQDVAPQEISQPQDGETEPEFEVDSTSEEVIRPEGWSDETHSKAADPNFEVVFSQDEVNRLDITIDSDDWAAMMADMTVIYGEFGSQPMMGQLPTGEGMPPDGGPAVPGEMPNPPEGGGVPGGGINPQAGGNPRAGGPPPGQGMGGMKEGDEFNPIWVPATVEFEGGTWTYVGIRFKGNSSLFSSWRSGNLKLPLKLDFDEFENDYTEIDDQRFYGFKQLSLSSNFHDSSFLREKVAADIFREAGVPSAHTAFYQVYIDYGEGPVYFGLYTMVEVIDDTVIEEQFADDSGNLYKPSGQGAKFIAGTFNEDSFDKETNQDEADYSDIQALFAALHTDLRMTNPAQWRAGLEAVFDVDGFLRWLAVNTVIQNWDTYGGISHNYYLYNDPETGLLTWIPWDNNEALQERVQRGNLSLNMDEVTDDWPLIRYIMDDPVYQGIYVAYVEEVVNGAFNPDEIKVKYQELHDLISSYVVGPNGEIDGYTHLVSESAFEDSVASLIQHAYNRYKAASEYVQMMQ